MSKANGHAPPKPTVKPLDLVGTAEAADILGVERPRIGRWIARGVMPDPVAHLQATPVWQRRHVERMLPWVEANRRHREKQTS